MSSLIFSDFSSLDGAAGWLATETSATAGGADERAVGGLKGLRCSDGSDMAKNRTGKRGELASGSMLGSVSVQTECRSRGRARRRRSGPVQQILGASAEHQRREESACIDHGGSRKIAGSTLGGEELDEVERASRSAR